MVALWGSRRRFGLDSTAVAFLGLGVLLATGVLTLERHREGGRRPGHVHLVRGALHAEQPAERARLHGVSRPAAGGALGGLPWLGRRASLVVAYVAAALPVRQPDGAPARALRRVPRRRRQARRAGAAAGVRCCCSRPTTSRRSRRRRRARTCSSPAAATCRRASSTGWARSRPSSTCCSTSWWDAMAAAGGALSRGRTMTYCRDRAPGESRAGHLPDAGRRVRHRAPPDRHVQARQRRRHAARRRADRAARHPGRPASSRSSSSICSSSRPATRSARSSSAASARSALPQVALTVVLCVTSLVDDGRRPRRSSTTTAAPRRA